MPVPLLVPVMASLAGAVLSEELAGEEEPRWTVDVPDGVFDLVGTGRVQGYLVVDFLERTVRGISRVTFFPAERTDWVLEVERLFAFDVQDWVRDRLDLLERCRPDVLAGGGREARDSFEESLEAAKWGPIRVMESAEQLLRGLEDNTSLQEIFFVLKQKGVLPFLYDHGDTTYVTGTRDEQVRSTLSWVREKFEDVLSRRRYGLPPGSVSSISFDELEPLALLGEPCLGFDVAFDVAEDEEEWAADVAREWSLEPVQRPDGTQVFRYLVREQ